LDRASGNNLVRQQAADKIRAKRVLCAYAIGVLALLLFLYTPLYIPCLFKLITGIQSPGCGLSRAFMMASQFDFWGAITINILFLPLAIGMAVYFVCALLDLFTDRRAIRRMNSILSKKWVIAAAALLMCISWYYNIVRGI